MTSENWPKGFIIGKLLILSLLSTIFVTGCGEHMGVDSSAILKLLTYNIHHGANGGDIFNLDATVETIRRSGADIVALQEVDRVWGERSSYCDEARYIAQKLAMNYAFGATLKKDLSPPGAGEFGIMILSKYKIMDRVFHLLPGALEQRGILLCLIHTPAGLIPVACTHLGLSVSDRESQIAEILTLLPESENVILLGDFNTGPEAGELKPLLSRFVDLQDAYGLGGEGTFFYQGNWVRIDYIFAAIRWRPNDCRVLPDQSSDHLPVYVEAKPTCQ